MSHDLHVLCFTPHNESELMCVSDRSVDTLASTVEDLLTRLGHGADAITNALVAMLAYPGDVVILSPVANPEGGLAFIISQNESCEIIKQRLYDSIKAWFNGHEN